MPAVQAALLCNRPAFWRFLGERHGRTITRGEEAARAVRKICGVASRREMRRGSEAAARWHELSAEFFLWLNEPLWKTEEPPDAV